MFPGCNPTNLGCNPLNPDCNPTCQVGCSVAELNRMPVEPLAVEVVFDALARSKSGTAMRLQPYVAEAVTVATRTCYPMTQARDHAHTTLQP